MVTVALVRNLVGLLHSDGAGKSNDQLDLPFCFKIASKKLQRLQNYVHIVIFPYITDFIYNEWPETHHQHSLQSLTILPKHSLTAGNLLQELKQQLD